ncbi:PucR family transcriptional regulator [Saccharopolyspora erythraea]|uniref:Regulatory protein n=1 Tax=Saccharopolyspora erythraea (strain ATCC 11635 / DSM 40517 / JCM 4748 / NBRC 13426 / NCIMB 8594 / NRRL 2338) TaxID=405948 RepID=A4F965_SACEN|nr:PucR family transcriptional regulator ligand-binding domain-containing protein [Saccharopolyspora erythraea]EQD87168.1 PucR family transcriptional regulator [Saccharopolyspora erythraea D]CAM00590.1 regulatory protein [Saccharopolyspora erythraea NRRL 2338]
MLLRDLLADPELGLVLLAGEEYVDRPVRGVYITDLLDPRRYLEGGELVLSGLVWHTGPQTSEQFVAALADAGVAGLASGTARLGHAPPDLVDACKRHGVPVFEVPLALSFNVLAERVQRRGAAPRRELVSAAASGAGLERVLSMAAGEFGADCWVLSCAGWVVGGTAELTGELRRALVDDVLRSGRLPRAVRVGDHGFAVWPVESDTEPPAARWFVAVRGDREMWGDEEEAIAGDLGTVVALLRARVDEARQIAGRSVEAALGRLLDGAMTPAEVAVRLETAGLPAGEPLRAVELHAGDRAASTALLREIAAATGAASVAVPLREGASAVFADDEEHLLALEGRLRDVIAEVEPGLGDRMVTVGLSDVSPVTGLRGALEEAGYARRLARQRRARSGAAGGAGLATGAELASHEVLLASVPDELRRSYRARLLSRLTEYDRVHNSDLVHTLRVFLDTSGSWSRSAKQLHVHVNTLRYRIQRIEEISGRDLSDFPTRVDFYLALVLDHPAS